MSIIVTDNGFSIDDREGSTCSPEALPPSSESQTVCLQSEDDPSVLADSLDRLTLIKVNFSSFSDGRGFTIARQLRSMGYKGRLRATGYIISDQYTMIRRSGFCEVEISNELAERQPQHQWMFRADWQQNDYQRRLGRINFNY